MKILTVCRAKGFTLIELLVVMSIVALLLSIAVPRYFNHVDKAKESVLKENLFLMRGALDKYYGDTGRYPDDLQELVTGKYLRRIPEDPITESAATWITVAPDNTAKGGVYDIKSGAPGKSHDGVPFSEL